MLFFVLRRLLLMVPTTIGIALVVFVIFHAAPGDPATVMIGAGTGGQLGQNSDVEGRVDKFRRKHGLDRSLLVQFFDYLGPFNLDRDGVPWFSSPYTERKTDEVELSGGEVALEGTPLPIHHLPGADPELSSELDAARATLLDDGAGEDAWAAAARRLGEAGSAAVPPLLTALDLLEASVESRRGAV